MLFSLYFFYSVCVFIMFYLSESGCRISSSFLFAAFVLKVFLFLVALFFFFLVSFVEGER